MERAISFIAARWPFDLAQQTACLGCPCPFLLTSRHSLGDHPHVFCLTLNELSEADSLAFIRYEGEERGVLAISEADDTTLLQVYSVTGGHPLTIKLVIGQVHSLPLERVLSRLREEKALPLY